MSKRQKLLRITTIEYRFINIKVMFPNSIILFPFASLRKRNPT